MPCSPTSAASPPIPPEVAARLDETLAGLVAERAAESDQPEPDRTVVPLRRRWAPRAAAAAAAVIVVGAGGVAAANLGVFGGHNDSMTSADGAASSKAESGGDSAWKPSGIESNVLKTSGLSARSSKGTTRVFESTTNPLAVR